MNHSHRFFVCIRPFSCITIRLNLAVWRITMVILLYIQISMKRFNFLLYFISLVIFRICIISVCTRTNILSTKKSRLSHSFILHSSLILTSLLGLAKYILYRSNGYSDNKNCDKRRTTMFFFVCWFYGLFL